MPNRIDRAVVVHVAGDDRGDPNFQACDFENIGREKRPALALDVIADCALGHQVRERQTDCA